MIYNDLIELYEDLDKGVKRMKGLLDSTLAKKDYRDLSIIEGDYKMSSLFHTKIKRILKDNFPDDIDNGIRYLEMKYKEERDKSKSMWESYGSELAGDYNAEEVKIGKKLNLLKGILK